ncbi:alanine racemase (plasmid) [Streptosporangium sp. CA-135522]|uniref:alanine racemase n=1 Tax=Streptosporangium sp. CA-135522 TaxID=3240072 RepID=UPI003D8DC6E9
MDEPARLRVHLDEAALRDNIQTVRRLLTPAATVMGVVKAHAYGHGLVLAARLLTRHGVQHLAVATTDEACTLRDAGLQVPITLLSPPAPAAMAELVARDLRPALSTLAAARDLHRIGVRRGRPVPVHLEIDTGLGRFGWAPTAASIAQITRLAALDHLVVCGIYTHLSSQDPDLCAHQLRLFTWVYAKAAAALGYRPPRHVLASSGLAAGLHRRTRLEMVRPGALLYGLPPSYSPPASPTAPTLDLRPVLSLTSRIEHLARLPSGTPIGYGATYRTAASTVVAVVPAGFADGVPRQLTGSGRVLICGHYAPVIGCVGMTHLTVDVTHIPQATVGETVILIGAHGERAIDAQEWARLATTINSDVLTRIAPAIARTVTTLPHAERKPA